MTTTNAASLTEAAPTTRGNYYSERTHWKTDIKRGVTRNRAGTRILSLTSDFLRGLRAAIQHECGPAAEEVLKKCGRNWGGQFASRFASEHAAFYGAPVTELPVAMFEACLGEMFSHHGWGRVRLDHGRHHQGLIIVTVEEPVFAELVGESDRPVESLLCGVLAGLFCHLTGNTDLDCVQTQCKACGHADSRFLVGLASRMATARALVEQGRGHDDIVTALEKVRG